MVTVVATFGAEEADSVEAELVARALAGDGSAFASLVRPHLSMLYRVAARTCRDDALAEDAVQETLEAAYKRLERYRPGSSLKAFLASIAVKRAHTLSRSERRRRAREESAQGPGAAATPEQLAQAGALGRRIGEILDGMPKKRRAAALLRLDGGLEYAEIAAALDTSTGSARVLVHLAVKELRERLAAEGLGGSR